MNCLLLLAMVHCRNVYRSDIKTAYDTLNRVSGDFGVNTLLAGWISCRLLSATSHQVEKSSGFCKSHNILTKDSYQ